jgi:hypothetical protein
MKEGKVIPLLRYIIKHYATKVYGGTEVFLPSELDGGEW